LTLEEGERKKFYSSMGKC